MTLRALRGSLPAEPASPPPGVRVVLDARPIQDPDRSPVTAAYLAGLLGAYDEDPLDGESFALLLRSDLDDPTPQFERLEIVGRRLLPPTRLLRSATLAVDPFVLAGASLGAAWRAERGGAAGAVYHSAGGAIPAAVGFPVVATILDLAAWELPAAYQRTAPSRLGQRLRVRLIRDAAAVIVGSDAVARSVRRLLRVPSGRIHVVPLAPRQAFSARQRRATTAADPEWRRLGVMERYLVYTGRHDARHDPATLFRALAALAGTARPDEVPADTPWPPRVVIVDASPEDRAAIARSAAREDVGDLLAYAPRLPLERLATLVRDARGVIVPAVSGAAGLAAIEAIAAGTPVVASTVGALPDVVGTAGILVEPSEPERLASALATVWTDDRVHAGLVTAARERALTQPSWQDVALATRRIYAEVATANRG
jgi:glycosyltransferase involved in cell wall biosynthesis